MDKLEFNPKTKELEFAIRAVQRAALLIRQVQEEMVSSTMTKKDLSPVTVGDLASQALVSNMLGDTFPSDNLVAEEDSEDLRKPEGKEALERVTGYVRRFLPQAEDREVCEWIDRGQSKGGDRFWVLDPIDGTKGYLRGGQYAVALALIVKGEVQVGVLGCPGLVNGFQPDVNGDGSIVVAARGQGTWSTSLKNPGEYHQLRVSDVNRPEEARLLRSLEDSHTDPTAIQTLADSLDIQAEPVRMDSQAKYAVLAGGGGEAMLRLLSPAKPDYREKIWDQAAGSIVIEEAGGCVTDLFGKALDFKQGRMLLNNRGILATNNLLHSRFLEGLQKVVN